MNFSLFTYFHDYLILLSERTIIFNSGDMREKFKLLFLMEPYRQMEFAILCLQQNSINFGDYLILLSGRTLLNVLQKIDKVINLAIYVMK